MRTWFWTLLVAVVAVALAVLLQHHPGNVLLLLWPWRIELSFPLAVLLGIAAFVVFYLLLRLLVWLVALPERVQAWRGRRAQARDHVLLERGWIQLLEGKFSHAQKDLLKLLEQTSVRERRVLAALSAARAAHALGDFKRCDQLFEVAREQANSHPGLREATATVAADMFLKQGRAEEALVELAHLQNGGTRRLHTKWLLLQAERALNHHDRVFALVRDLLRHNAIDKTEAHQIIDMAGAARLRAARADDSWRLVWKDFKTEERLLPNIALGGAAAFEAAGEAEEAARILEAALNVKFDPSLMAAYACCDAEQVPRRLAKAEIWLQQRTSDPEILTALGMLCLNGQLWGQAERYLLRSLACRSEPRAHALLGSLYDCLDRPAQAVRHWRLAAAASITLPVLTANTVLPPAQTEHDPSRFDAEGGYMPDDFSSDSKRQQHKDEQSAGSETEYESDQRVRSPHQAQEDVAAHLVKRARPVVSPQSGDIEEYFDSAPIPLDAFDDRHECAPEVHKPQPLASDLDVADPLSPKRSS